MVVLGQKLWENTLQQYFVKNGKICSESAFYSVFEPWTLSPKRLGIERSSNSAVETGLSLKNRCQRQFQPAAVVCNDKLRSLQLKSASMRAQFQFGRSWVHSWQIEFLQHNSEQCAYEKSGRLVKSSKILKCLTRPLKSDLIVTHFVLTKYVLWIVENMKKSVRLLLLVAATFILEAKASCPSQCACANDGLIVDCSKKGLTRIPSNLPRNTVTL